MFLKNVTVTVFVAGTIFELKKLNFLYAFAVIPFIPFIPVKPPLKVIIFTNKDL